MSVTTNVQSVNENLTVLITYDKSIASRVWSFAFGVMQLVDLYGFE